MASLRDSVKDYQEELRDGIAWVAFWKEGRSWNAELFHLEVDGTLEPFDRSRLEEIKAADPAAVILNGYYCGHLGENMSLDELTAGVRHHYKNGTNDVAGFIEAHDDRLPPELIEEAKAAAHAAGLPFSEKPYRDGEDFDPYVFDGSMSIEDYELMHRMIEKERSEQMDEWKTGYSSYDHDRLEAADKMKIERGIYFDTKGADISPLTALPLAELVKLREESAAAEQTVFENLKVQASAWEEQAGKTLLFDKAIEYARYPLAAICFVIILISGVFMISSCMNSTVAQRTKFFGMMRCIGASKKQIIHFVRLEALNWCKTAIPIGCILGTITCWILCAILRFLVKGEWADMPLFSVSVTGILCGAVVGIVTVFIAAHSPAKQAAKVSPVAAVSGNTGTSKHGGCAAKSGVFKIETSLGIHHATEAKKNLFLITGSFALTIALFLSFAACLDLVHKLLPSVSDFTPDIVISSEDETNSVDRNLAEDISEIPGVKSVFGTKLHVAYPVEINGNAGTVDLFSYDESMLDSFKKSVMSGDLSKVYGNSGYALAIYNQDNRLNVGDKIKIGDTEIEIACIASEGVGSVSGAATMVCSEETYTQLTGEQDYALVSVVLEKNISETEVSKIRNLSSDYVFADNRAENSDVNGSYWVFRLAAYGFLAIISFITILNIMNSISMSVSARIKQYGAMRAVGMGNRQITKMITAEAITYAACGTIIGFVLGLLLHYLIYVKIIVTHFGGTWKVPVVPMEIIVLLVLVSCILAVYAPAKRIRNMAITATINEL